MKILALSTNYKYHQDVLEALRGLGVEADFATSHKPESEGVMRPFYEKYKTRLINGTDFYHLARLQKLVPATAPVLDKEILQHFEMVERDFYTITDRYAYYPKSFRYRKRLFREGLRYWLDFFGRNKIDGVFSICAPHNIPDFLAFHTAQYLGIKTLMTTDAMVNDHTLLLNDYRQAFKVPVDYMANKSDEEIMAAIKPGFAAAAFAESNQMVYNRQLNDIMLNMQGANASAKQKGENEMLQKFKKRARKFVSLQMFMPHWKAGFAMNGEYSDNRRRLIRIQAGRRLAGLKKAYEALAIEPDLSTKFVYFALHLNPERTTQPEAEIFEDQLLALELLSRAVPADWLIYVKENPAQYKRKMNLINGRHFRDRSDYDDFLRLPNVRLIRQEVKTAELIEKAALVASLKGSVGWERINIGKPCLIFANAWYSACRAAYRANSLASCQAAIEAILTKTPAEVHSDKLKFFAYMQDYIIPGVMGSHHSLKIAVMPYEKIVSSLAKNIKLRLSADI